MGLMQDVLKSQVKEKLPKFNVGDVVDVSVKIKEGEKERIQVYTGTVISRRGSGMDEMFTVRRIVAGEGVARNKDLGGGLEVGRVLPHGEILHHDNLGTVQAIVPGEETVAEEKKA